MKSIKLLGAVLLVSSLLAVKLSAMDDAALREEQKTLKQISVDITRTVTSIDNIREGKDYSLELCNICFYINSIFDSFDRCSRIDCEILGMLDNLINYLESRGLKFGVELSWLVGPQRENVQKLRDRLAKQEAEATI